MTYDEDGSETLGPLQHSLALLYNARVVCPDDSLPVTPAGEENQAHCDKKASLAHTSDWRYGYARGIGIHVAD